MLESFIPITPRTILVLGAFVVTTLGIYFGPDLIKKYWNKHQEKKKKC